MTKRKADDSDEEREDDDRTEKKESKGKGKGKKNINAMTPVPLLFSVLWSVFLLMCDCCVSCVLPLQDERDNCIREFMTTRATWATLHALFLSLCISTVLGLAHTQPLAPNTFTIDWYN